MWPAAADEEHAVQDSECLKELAALHLMPQVRLQGNRKTKILPCFAALK